MPRWTGFPTDVRSRTADPYGFFSAGKKGKDKLPPPWLYELAGPPGPPGIGLITIL